MNLVCSTAREIRTCSSVGISVSVCVSKKHGQVADSTYQLGRDLPAVISVAEPVSFDGGASWFYREPSTDILVVSSQSVIVATRPDGQIEGILQ